MRSDAHNLRGKQQVDQLEDLRVAPDSGARPAPDAHADIESAEGVALLHRLFACSPTPLVILDSGGRSVLANPAYRELFGEPTRFDRDVFDGHDAVRATATEGVRRAFGGEAVRMDPFWYDRKRIGRGPSKETRPVALACTLFPLFDARREITHVGVVLRDVTTELVGREQAEDERDAQKAAARKSEKLTEALRLSEERLRRTLDVAEIGTWEWNVQENSVNWSENIEGLFGMREGAFSGTYEGWFELVHPDDRAMVTRRIERALADFEPYNVECRFVRPDGSIRFQDARGYIVRDEAGRPLIMRGTVHDVTERRTAEDTRRMQAQVLENMTEGVLVTNAHGTIVYTTPAEDRMFGYEPGELIGKHVGILNDLEPGESERAVASVFEALEKDGAWKGEFKNRRKDGSLFTSRAHITRLDIEGAAHTVSVQEDITAQVAAREQADAANRAKDEFLAMLGHELRNPMAPLLTAVELMKMRAPGVFEAERAVIERQVKHVVRLVDDLLDVSRITRGKISIQRQRLDLAKVIAGSIELASPLIEQNAHRLVVELPDGLFVQGDALRLRQIFSNLLNNAAKYSKPGSTITIVGQCTDSKVTVSVCDTGIGIKPEILPKVFDFFVQEQQAIDRSEGGLGLGLAIVKALVTLHDGTVTAHSEGQGRGSEFRVVLPLAPESAPVERTESAPPSRPPAASRRVLVVDDNTDAAALLSDLLRGEGHVVEVAYDGPTALKLLEDFTPDLALLDIGLPVMDGYELARRIRSSAKLSGLRLIAVSGYGDERAKTEARQAGFEELLVKPVEFAWLEEVLANAG